MRRGATDGQLRGCTAARPTRLYGAAGAANNATSGPPNLNGQRVGHDTMAVELVDPAA